MWAGFRMTRHGLDAMPQPLRPLIWSRIQNFQQQAANLQQEEEVLGDDGQEEELDDEGQEEEGEESSGVDEADSEEMGVVELADEADSEEDEEMGVVELADVVKVLTQEEVDFGFTFPINDFLNDIFPFWPQDHHDIAEQIHQGVIDNFQINVRAYDFRSTSGDDFMVFEMGLRRIGDAFYLGNRIGDPANWFATNFSTPNMLSAGDEVCVGCDLQELFLHLDVQHQHEFLEDPLEEQPQVPANGPYFLGWETIKVLRRVDIEETLWFLISSCPDHLVENNQPTVEVNVRDLQHSPVRPIFMNMTRNGLYFVFNRAIWQQQFVQINNLAVGNTIGMYWDGGMECFVFARLAE